MPRTLRIALLLTDFAFLAYWSLAALNAAHLIQIPVDWLYADADQPRVVAWNWSFFPLDIAFSATGLLAVRRAGRGDPGWRALALVSLVLTIVAGGMAVGYWTLLGEINLSWFLPNLALVLWPIPFLPGLFGSLRSGG
jgi:hypothetical protein